MPALDNGEITRRLPAVKAWSRSGDEITREFKFGDFRQAMAFVNKVADAANAADHHPDITINYNRVALTLSTHSEGGLTAKDFDMAAAIDAVS